jgi:hypothetical protein
MMGRICGTHYITKNAYTNSKINFEETDTFELRITGVLGFVHRPGF